MTSGGEGGRPRDPEVGARIIEVARAIIDAEGLEGLSVTRVAREAGVGRPTVYRRYSSAEDLARAVLLAELDGISQRAHEIEIPDGPVVDRLVAITGAAFAFYGSNVERSRILLSVSLFAQGEWRARWEELTAQVAHFVVAVILEAQAKGELRRDIDLQLLLTAYFSLYLAVLVGGLAGGYGPPEAWAPLFHRLMEQHLSGLRPDGWTGEPQADP